MDKATPTTPPAPASYDSVMALYKEVMEALLFDSDSVADAETEFLAEVERLAAQAAPSEQADLRQLMGMNEAEIDTELIAAGISPDDAVKRADRAIKEALATIRAERRASSGATTQAVRMPAVTAFNVGRFCLSEDDCIAQRIDFSAYERGVADAAEAFSRNT